jgi:hypothetical protein
MLLNIQKAFGVENRDFYRQKLNLLLLFVDFTKRKTITSKWGKDICQRMQNVIQFQKE